MAKVKEIKKDIDIDIDKEIKTAKEIKNFHAARLELKKLPNAGMFGIYTFKDFLRVHCVRIDDTMYIDAVVANPTLPISAQKDLPNLNSSIQIELKGLTKEVEKDITTNWDSYVSAYTAAVKELEEVYDSSQHKKDLDAAVLRLQELKKEAQKNLETCEKVADKAATALIKSMNKNLEPIDIITKITNERYQNILIVELAKAKIEKAEKIVNVISMITSGLT